MARESKKKRDERRFGKSDRLVDAAINGEWKLPYWYKPPEAESASLAEYRRRVIDDLRLAKIVIADNVCEYFYAGTSKEVWHVETDFPCCAPPHDVIFIEMKRPSKINSEGRIIDSRNMPEMWGWLFKFSTVESSLERMNDPVIRDSAIKALEDQLQDLFPKVDKGAIMKANESGHFREEVAKLGMHEQTFAMMAVQYNTLKKNLFAEDMVPRGMKWGAEGELIMKVGDAVVLVATTKIMVDESGKIIDHPLISIFGGLQLGIEEAIEFRNMVNPMSFPAFLTLSFMHCKNVVVQAVEPDRRLNREREQHGLKPFVRYHTIDIEPMKKVLRTEGQIESQGLKRALHICRGHFSTYSEERPLFGRIAGTFWVPSHVRGTADKGVVISDYKVKT